MRTETKLNIAVAAAVVLLAAAFKLSAAPTANEDYVDAQDAQTYTNALRDANAYTDAATGAVRRVDGEARVLPRYLHTLKFYDSYPDVADWYYSRYGRAGGACSSVRDGNTLARNYDWDFDAAPSFVIGMDAGPCRFASVGVASVGTNLTEDAVTRGRPSKFYKALPGMTLDGVNENGVAANVNVVSSFGHTNGWHGSALHCLGAVRWVLDHATNAQHGAEFLAANVYVPQSMIDAGYSYHYMIADAAETWIAEDGQARMVGTVANRSVMTNFRNFDPLADPYGTGRERYTLLENGGSITSAWFTLAYVSPGRESEFRAPGVDAAAACARAVASWATKPKEQHRGETFEGGAHWWQSVHTSVYDLTNRVLRVAVQEADDWYTFQVPNAGGVKAESDPTVPAWAKAPNPPAAMPNEGVVLTNGALRTKGGTSVTPAAIGAASAADVQTLNVGYTRLYNFSIGATNANFTATNYPPTQAEADQRCHWQPEPGMDFTTVPASLQLNEYRDGALRTVVDQRDWTTWYVKFKEAQLTNELARLRAENAALSNKLETAKAWANFTANGVENPLDDTVVVDRPNMWLMADYDWQKVVSGSNQCFVIHAKNIALSGGANTNGFLEVLDAFGKPYMRINKSSETFADPVFSEIYQDGNDGPWYIVFSNTTKPTKGGANLALRGTGTGKAIFYAEDDPECPAVITWPDVPESHAGHWIMRAQPKPVNGVIPSAMFFGAEIRVSGSDYVEYLKEASFGAGVRFGNNVYDYVESGDQLILRRRQ